MSALLSLRLFSSFRIWSLFQPFFLRFTKRCQRYSGSPPINSLGHGRSRRRAHAFGLLFANAEPIRATRQPTVPGGPVPSAIPGFAASRADPWEERRPLDMQAQPFSALRYRAENGQKPVCNTPQTARLAHAQPVPRWARLLLPDN